MRVLVCGGRYFDNWPFLRDYMHALHKRRRITCLIEGGAPGADALAEVWATRAGVGHISYHADWKAHGPAAGPIRNQRMLDEDRPDLVVAFPGGKGTADMIRRARAAGVEVVEPKP